ncbi:MAG: autotransporter adhesin family protein [Spirochaetaceae bacterium]|jgi:hypothetical protein|nr:autotransporter adhesin family protein [Spirochaetaceae bacterium]
MMKKNDFRGIAALVFALGFLAVGLTGCEIEKDVLVPVDGPAVPVTDFDLTPYVPAPVLWDVPVTYFTAPQYYGTVAWTYDTETETDTALTGRFAEPQYTAEFTLTAASGYTFAGVSGGFTHTGSATPDNGAIPFTDAGATRTGTIVFPNYNYQWCHGSFSGDPSEEGDSAIDMIKAAADQPTLYLLLTLKEDEGVCLNAGDIGAWTDSYGFSQSGLDLFNDPSNSNSPANVTIDGGGRTIKLLSTGADYDPFINVNAGVTLTLRNITLQGLNTNNCRFINVNSGGHLILETGAVITGNSNGGGNGGGVYVYGGTFTMNGGAISGNTTVNGGGVYVDGGTFTMNGGTISGNNATNNDDHGGGGVYVADGTFTMNGGTISGNNATNKYGGGVYVYGGTFTKTGGTIYGGDDNTHEPLKGENTATSEQGHAVYAYSVDGSHKWRNSKAGPGDALKVTYDEENENLITSEGLDNP